MRRPRRNFRSLSALVFVLAGIAASLPVTAAASQSAPPPGPYAEALRAFESFVSEQMAFDRIPGMTIGFIKGEFTWVKGFGFADVENGSPARPESSYRLASITKTITALAVLQLVEEGKIDLDSEIQKYVPYFPRKRWPVTVRQLLGHIGGVRHYQTAAELQIKEPMTTRQAIAVFENSDLAAEPGTRFNYSSYGYNLLGAAIESASGLSYDEYIRKHIFERLSMLNSGLENRLGLVPNRVRGYRIINGELQHSEYVDLSSRFAAAGVRSTVPDLLNYARGIIDEKLLKESTWRKIFSPMALRNGFFTWYGMGWEVWPWNGHFTVNHNGSLEETRTYLMIFPVDRLAVAVASNLEDADLLPYVRRLVELVLDEDIDSYAFTPDRVLQAIYGAAFQVYSYGISAYEWTGKALSKSRNDLEEAFAYFNGQVGEKELQRDFEKAKKRIAAGVHLAAKQAFTKVGSYMAGVLAEEGGKDKIAGYHRLGPIAFFDDYIRLARPGSSSRPYPRFRPEFITLMAGWEKDWTRTHTDSVRDIFITPSTDFDALFPRLKTAFVGASLYPDFTTDLARIAGYELRQNDADKAIRILTESQAQYPESPTLLATTGLAYLWKREAGTGEDYFRKAHDADPSHPVIGPDELVRDMRFLMRGGRLSEAIALGNLAIGFHPNDVRLYIELAQSNLMAGQKIQAAESLRKALRIDPTSEELKARLRVIEKLGGTK